MLPSGSDRFLSLDNAFTYMKSSELAKLIAGLGIRRLTTQPRPAADQRQGLCLSFGLLSGVAARLSTPIVDRGQRIGRDRVVNARRPRSA